METTEKYHYDFVVRSTRSDHKKKFYLDDKYGKIITHRKTKSKGVTLKEIQDEIGLANFRLDSELAKDLKRMNSLDWVIEIGEKLYSKTNGRLGWSPRMVQIVKKMSEGDEEK